MTEHALAHVENETSDAVPESEARKWWLLSVEFWALIGGISALITAITTLAAVFVGFRQLGEARAISQEQAAYAGFSELQSIGVEHPELWCPNTDASFGALMAQPASAARYSAYGNLVINNSEQLLRMGNDDGRWNFLIRERIRCHAPAIRYLMREGSYTARYSCRLRQLIAEEMRSPRPGCPAED